LKDLECEVGYYSYTIHCITLTENSEKENNL
jgi:hypothetical protein